MMPKLKICGLMRQQDVALCCDLGVDICGFVTDYPISVPWNLTREQCAPLLPAVNSTTKSCIVTGGTRDNILSLALELRPNLIQLHYHETLEDTCYLADKLNTAGIGVIKTIPLSAEDRMYQFGVSDPSHCVELLNQAGVYAILVDSRQPSNAASQKNGQIDNTLYWAVKQAAACPVMLGGGIVPENCSRIVHTLHPDILDVMSGVENSPGIKSEKKLRKLLLKSFHE